MIIDLLNGFAELLINGFIHRDLKPANILISQGKFKLAGNLYCIDKILDLREQ